MSAEKKQPWAGNVEASGKTVTVGCKLPNGLHMDYVVPGKPLRRVTLNGANSSTVIGGFGITRDVPEEFFNEWLKRHAELPAVRNGLIFAHKEFNAVQNEVKSRSALRNGLEPIDAENPGSGLQPISAKEA